MPFTKEQEEFLATFADKGMKEQADELARIAKAEADSAAYAAREAFVASLKSQKEQEIADAISAYDSAALKYHGKFARTNHG